MVSFPESLIISYPATLEPNWKTRVTDFESGKEQRRQVWPFPKRRVNIQSETAPQEEAIDTLYNFYGGMAGAFDVFWFFWRRRNSDGNWPLWNGELVGRGDGSKVIFELPSKTTLQSSLVVYVNGVETSVTFLSGGGDAGVDRIQFAAPVANGALVTADFRGSLRIKARFASDKMSFELFVYCFFNTGIELMEVR